MSATFAISVPIGAWHPFLPDCLESLCAQGPLVEIAALDASGDTRVAAVLDRFEDKLAFRRTGPDDGQSDAIIEGWAQTTAPFLGWLNADDALYPGALKAVAKRLAEDPTADVVYGDSTIVDDAGAYRGYHWAVKPPTDRLLRDCIISQPSCFFRREKVDAIGGLRKDLHYTMDWDLWVRLWRADARFVFHDAVLSRVLWSRDAKTGGFNAARRNELERIIGVNGDIIAKTKARIGFALHHAFEYRVPPQIADLIRRRNADHGRTIHGVDRAGGIKEQAKLPLMYYGEETAGSLTLVVSSGSAGEASVGSAPIKFSGGQNELKLPNAIKKGEVAWVEIAPTSPTYLVSVGWS